MAADHKMARKKLGADKIRGKIEHVMNLLKTEQKIHEDLMKEFLRLSSDVENQQMPRTKTKIAASERRLKKSADIIAHMQRKLSNYAEQLHELNMEPASAPEEDKNRMSRRSPSAERKVMVNDFAQSNEIKDTDRHTSIADHLSDDEDEIKLNSYSAAAYTITHQSPSSPASSVDRSSKTSSAVTGWISKLNNQRAMFATVAKLKEEHTELRLKISALKAALHHDVENMKNLIEIEHDLCERLNLQINDLTELHEHEVEDIKQELVTLGEKAMYKISEKTHDIQEQLDYFQSRISKMESQQAQQLAQKEQSDKSKFSIGAAINLLLNAIGLVFVLLSTVLGILSPFLVTRWRYITTFVVLLTSLAVWCYWDWVYPTAEWLVYTYYFDMPVPPRPAPKNQTSFRTISGAK